MKNTLFIILAFLLVNTGFMAQAQTDGVYNNEWINYDQTYYKIKIGEERLYRIDYLTLDSYGIADDIAQLKLYVQGQEIPMYVSNPDDFGIGDYVEFYGTINNGSFDTQMYLVEEWQPQPYNSLFNDTATYYLTVANEGEPLRYQNIDNDISDIPTAEDYFMYKSFLININTHNSGKPYRLGGTNNYLSDFEDGEGFVGQSISVGNDRTYNVRTPSIYSTTGEVITVNTNIIGQSNAFGITSDESPIPISDHQLQVEVNGNLHIDDIFDGYQSRFYDFTIPISQLSSPNTPITFTSVDQGWTNTNAVAYITIEYPHSYDFASKYFHRFTINNNEDKYLEITNFNGGDAPVLYDLTHNQRFLPIEEDGVYKIFLPQVTDGNATRKLFITNTSTSFPLEITTPISSLEETNFTNYAALANQGNFLIISHPRLMQGDINEVERYANYRNSLEGGAYTSIIVNIEELYDQFAFGIRKHPLSVRYFVRYAMDNWDITPEHLFLLGKSIDYANSYPLSTLENYLNNLIPTYGDYPSDIMLTATNVSSYRFAISTGRVPAQTPADVRAYLDKVIAYEAVQNTNSCDPEELLYLKQALHIAGGNDLPESNQFLATLFDYEQIYESPKMGGEVLFTYNKLTEEVITTVDLGDFINEGLSIINFVGHGTGENWNLDIDEAAAYENFEKYPFIFASSCFVGDIHGPTIFTMAEDYVLAEGKGSIGFLATVRLGFPSFLDIYLEELYEQFSDINYNKPIGECIRITVDSLFIKSPGTSGEKLTAQEFTLAADPAIKINSFTTPEYVLEESNVFFTPLNISAELDSFAINAVISNIGMATTDSFTVKVERTFPDGNTQVVAEQLVPSTLLTDTITIYLPVGDAINNAGLNNLSISIDANNAIDERCEDNNEVSKDIFIFSDLLIPVSPCNFTIVNEPDITLYASTGQPIIAEREYIFQIDTSMLFTPPLAEQIISSESGVLTWQPPINLQNETVYYWRTGVYNINTDSILWKSNSFYFDENATGGWAQKHYYQLIDNQFNGVYLDSISRKVEFQEAENMVQITNNKESTNLISFIVNSLELQAGTCLQGECAGGIAFALLKPGLQLEAIPSIKDPSFLFGCDGRGDQWNNIHCTSAPKYVYEFNTSDPEQLTAMNNFLDNAIPDGYYVAMYSVGEHNINDLPSDLYNKLNELCNNLGINNLNEVSNEDAFNAFGRIKQNTLPYPIEEASTFFNKGTSAAESLTNTLEFTAKQTQGTMRTPLIGPFRLVDDGSAATVISNVSGAYELEHIYGIDGDLNEYLLRSSSPELSSELGYTVLAAPFEGYTFYRYEKVYVDTLFGDSFNAAINGTITYEPPASGLAPDLALNYQHFFNLANDTLQQGEPLEFSYALTNVESLASDSIYVQYTVINENNEEVVLDVPLYAPIPGKTTDIMELIYSSENFVGDNILEVSVNANGPGQQLEKFDFNNLMYIPFHVTTDEINPIIDVTFDGRHIIDDDIVATQPEITISVTDENPYLALNDTSDIKLFLTYPDENGIPLNQQPLYFNDPMVDFIAASDPSGSNKAQVVITPSFTQNGSYILQVMAYDRSNNRFADANYNIRFKVITESMISNLVNYPNPFTSNTRFVFTLTGNDIPETMKIQILTITGKVVREITQDELGEIRIGNNISEFAWDGTDQFGNPLANGIYLYRVVAKLNGENIDHYETAADDYFKKDLGKMYLMR